MSGWHIDSRWGITNIPTDADSRMREAKGTDSRKKTVFLEDNELYWSGVRKTPS